ncbi:MAG: type II secretion system protein [Planctomycetota bacterium]
MRGKRAFTLIELLVVIAIIALLVSILLPALGAARQHAKKAKCAANLRTIGHAVQFYLGDHRDVFPEAGFYGCLGYIGRSPYHAILGSQVPEDRRPLNRYLNVEKNILDANAPQGADKFNEVILCPADRGDAYFKLPATYFVEHGTSYTYASDCNDPYVPTFGIRSCRSLRLVDVKFPTKKIVFQEPVFNPSFDLQDDRSHWHHVGAHHANLLFADLHVAFAFCKIYNWMQLPDENEVYY